MPDISFGPMQLSSAIYPRRRTFTTRVATLNRACDNARGGVGQAVASFAITSVKAGAEESPGSTGHGAR